LGRSFKKGKEKAARQKKQVFTSGDRSNLSIDTKNHAVSKPEREKEVSKI